MWSTGIIRRVDDLGRIVIPKEIRNQLKIREGEALEIFVDNVQNMICLKKSADRKKVADLVAQFKSMNETEKEMFLSDIEEE